MLPGPKTARFECSLDLANALAHTDLSLLREFASTLMLSHMTAPIRLLIADDHPVVRDGMRLALCHGGFAEIVGEAADGPGALSLAQQTTADVLLLDVHLPSLNGFEVLRALRSRGASLRVVLMSGAADASTMQRGLQLGANGIYSKSESAEALRHALQSVLDGGHYISPALSTSGDDRLSKLTSREREVLEAVGAGLGSKQIADRLGLSINTVHKHRENLIAKLALRGSAELVAIAAKQAGMVAL
jgi:DNA-binding NarL/FixJ family response regulator